MSCQYVHVLSYIVTHRRLFFECIMVPPRQLLRLHQIQVLCYNPWCSLPTIVGNNPSEMFYSFLIFENGSTIFQQRFNCFISSVFSSVHNVHEQTKVLVKGFSVCSYRLCTPHLPIPESAMLGCRNRSAFAGNKKSLFSISTFFGLLHGSDRAT